MKLQAFSTILSKKGEILSRALSTATSCKDGSKVLKSTSKLIHALYHVSSVLEVLMTPGTWMSNFEPKISLGAHH